MSLFAKLPTRVEDFMDWTWEQLQPYADELLTRDLTADNVIAWLTDRARLGQIIGEIVNRLYVATSLNTKDEAAQQRFLDFLSGTVEKAQIADQKMKEKLLASGLEPEGYAIQLRNLRTQAAIFREANVPLFTKEESLNQQYSAIVGGQTVEWEGEKRTVSQMRPIMMGEDRAVRERAWRLVRSRQLEDRGKLNDLWVELLKLRREIAANADEPDYRSFAWKLRLRFDYTPEDCLGFHHAIEQTVVPAARRIYERMAARMGIDSVRPWDLDADVFALHHPPLKPFTEVDELDEVTRQIFERVDPALGAFYQTMQEKKLLDLANYEGKAPGGYCTYFPFSKTPFIFMNAVGLHDDVQTLLHEGGHAFHAFEASRLPDYQDGEVPIEFAEVASMSMELLAAPYLTAEKGGFYSEKDAARARIEHLEGNISFLPYMAVVDAFQHWVYTHHDEATDPAACDAYWRHLWSRFMVGVDYNGLEDFILNRWRYQGHIFQAPFYYIDYGLAQVGAMQVWRNALRDQAEAVRKYRAALSLGDTRTLPELFNAAGAAFAFDTDTLRELIDLTENTIHELEAAEC